MLELTVKDAVIHIVRSNHLMHVRYPKSCSYYTYEARLRNTDWPMLQSKFSGL